MYFESQNPLLKPSSMSSKICLTVVAVEPDLRAVGAEHRHPVELQMYVKYSRANRLDCVASQGCTHGMMPRGLELRRKREEIRIVVRRVLRVLADLREELLVPTPHGREVVERQRAQHAVARGEGCFLRVVEEVGQVAEFVLGHREAAGARPNFGMYPYAAVVYIMS